MSIDLYSLCSNIIFIVYINSYLSNTIRRYWPFNSLTKKKIIVYPILYLTSISTLAILVNYNTCLDIVLSFRFSMLKIRYPRDLASLYNIILALAPISSINVLEAISNRPIIQISSLGVAMIYPLDTKSSRLTNCI